jgi:hypothetical protein
LPDSLSKGGYINSISYNPDLDYILVDVNQVRKLVVIDHKGAGKVVYTYLVGTSGSTHAAEWVHKNFMGTSIPMPDADNTAMRLNNLLVVHNSTEAVEVNFTTNTKVKAFTFAFSAHEGSVQRLPNGNTLVCNASNKATELDDNGKTVRTITLPGSVQRAYMYGPTYPGLKIVTVIAAMISTAAAGKFTYNATANTGTITVANNVESPLDVRMYSLYGRMVYSSSSAGGKAVFSTRNLQAGIYFVDVHHASGSFRASIVKLR